VRGGRILHALPIIFCLSKTSTPNDAMNNKMNVSGGGVRLRDR
jgi:hypothetical protein